jgi:hypothetical protein
LSFILTFPARIVRCILIVAVLGVSALGQVSSTVSTQHLYRADLVTGRVVFDIWQGAELESATKLESSRGPGWSLIGATEVDGIRKLVYFDSSNRGVAVDIYGVAGHGTLPVSASLATLGAGWTARAIADVAGDGSLGIIAANETSGQVAAYLFGGTRGTTFLRSAAISPLSVSGWNVVGAADLDANGHPDLVLQNSSTRQVRVAYLGGASGTTVTATEDLDGSAFREWTAVGMQDMNGDGHPDLILVSDRTGESIVSYYGGETGVSYLGSSYLDRSGSTSSKIVVPSQSAATADASSSVAVSATTEAAKVDVTEAAAVATPSVLIFNGTGTIANDVTAVESVVSSLGLAYKTATSSQLDGMSESQLAAYKLMIVPGGNSITIGENLSATATSNVHNAVAKGLNYLGICAGGFFGGFSAYYNGLNLTSGVWFSVYPNSGRGTGKTAVEISFPNRPELDIYWQDGPELSGWGEVVGKYPDGTPALVEGYMGDGFVILSGVHPEAPASWRDGMTFSTPVDTDLAFASSLVTAAMNRDPLPHF